MKAIRLTVGLVLVAGISFSATSCSIVHGQADRTDEFVAGAEDCQGSWWLGPLREGTDPEAADIARLALEGATVSDDKLAEALDLLDLSHSDTERDKIQPADLQSEAYMLAVTLQVKAALSDVGYPDTDRVIEIWTDHTCS